MSLQRFTNPAVDYAEPFIKIHGRNIKMILVLVQLSGWILIHFKHIFENGKSSGTTEVMFSDNGGNFVNESR